MYSPRSRMVSLAAIWARANANANANATGNANAKGGAVYIELGTWRLERTNVSDSHVSTSGSGDYAGAWSECSQAGRASYLVV